RRARIKPRFRIELLTSLWKVDHVPAGFQRFLAQDRLERIGCPPGFVDRLSVVVRIETNRASGARRLQLSEDCRRAIAFEQSCIDAAPPHHLDYPRSVAP